jgi:hypothetical protein
MKTTPFRHQKLAFEKASNDVPPAPGMPRPCDAFAYFMEPGTGKTKSLIDDAARAYLAGEIELLLVLAPNGVHRNWLGELELHCGVPYQAAFYRSGTVNKQARAVLDSTGVLKVLTVNSESLSHKSGLAFCLAALAGRRAMVVLDESHRFKTPGAARTRNSWKLSRMAVQRRLATGTEITKGYEDLYAQFRFLDPAIIGAKTFADFKAMYCVMVGDYNQIVDYRNVDHLLGRVGPYVFSAAKADCLDLPAQVFLQREVELSPEQARYYKELRDRFVTPRTSWPGSPGSSRWWPGTCPMAPEATATSPAPGWRRRWSSWGSPAIRCSSGVGSCPTSPGSTRRSPRRAWERCCTMAASPATSARPTWPGGATTPPRRCCSGRRRRAALGSR